MYSFQPPNKVTSGILMRQGHTAQFRRRSVQQINRYVVMDINTDAITNYAVVPTRFSSDSFTPNLQHIAIRHRREKSNGHNNTENDQVEPSDVLVSLLSPSSSLNTESDNHILCQYKHSSPFEEEEDGSIIVSSITCLNLAPILCRERPKLVKL